MYAEYTQPQLTFLALNPWVRSAFFHFVRSSFIIGPFRFFQPFRFLTERLFSKFVREAKLLVQKNCSFIKIVRKKRIAFSKVFFSEKITSLVKIIVCSVKTKQNCS